MQLKREGRFKAKILRHAVNETGQNRLVTFMAEFQIVAELDDDVWHPREASEEITGYFYLEKKDGELNSGIIKSLKSALGWDGVDPFWLQDTDLRGRVVQLNVKAEVYDGKTRYKVAYIDAEDVTGSGAPGIEPAVGALRSLIESRIGEKLKKLAKDGPAKAANAAGGLKSGDWVPL